MGGQPVLKKLVILYHIFNMGLLCSNADNLGWRPQDGSIIKKVPDEPPKQKVRVVDNCEERSYQAVDGSKNSAWAKFTYEHKLSIARLRVIAKATLSELQKGLKGEESSFQMLESHVREMPKGTETGTFYAFDLGGNNLRIIKVVLKGGGRSDVRVHKAKVPKNLRQKTASAEQLFGFIANEAKTACEKFKDLDSVEKISVGFTFSFPIHQKRLNKATLIKWTKSFQTCGCVGEDVGVLMQRALWKKGVPLNIEAICNDTVGTLVACALEHPTCRVGIIMGTGSNAAYYDPDTGSVINIEWGGLNKGLPRTDVDRFIDANSDHPGQHPFEKMISGLYLGRMVMLNLRKVRPDLTISDDMVAEFSGHETKKIITDVTPDLKVTHQVLQDSGFENPSLQDRRDVQLVTEVILNRSADLCAAALFAVLLKMGETGDRKVTVGIDGSVYKMDPNYKSRVRYTLSRLIGFNTHKVVIVDTEDGSGKGAAVVVAAFAAKRLC